MYSKTQGLDFVLEWFTLLIVLFSMTTISPFSLLRNLAPTISSAQVSDANI